MDDSAAAATITLTLESSTMSSNLRRRNSIATSVLVPTKLTLPATPRHRSSFNVPPKGITTPTNTQTPPSLLDLKLVSLKSSSSSYTSLKDVLASSNAAINSPTVSSEIINSAYEISIRNRLVKQAAWAYLQPKFATPNSSSGPYYLRHFWPCLSCGHRNPLTACVSFFYHQLVPGITRMFDRILGAIRGQVSS